MDLHGQNYTLQPVYTQHSQRSHGSQQSQTQHGHAPMTGSSWHQGHHSSTANSSSSAQASAMFTATHHAPDLDYPSPAPSVASPPYMQHQHQSEQYAGHHQPSSFTPNASNNGMLSPFVQVDSSIGPTRILTRRQRAALEQNNHHRRRASVQSNYSRETTAPPSRRNSGLYLTPPGMASRPQTPSNPAESGHYQTQSERLSVNIASAVPSQMQTHSPTYHPITPTSSSSSFSPYQPYPGHHSRSSSSSNVLHPRSASPALSTASALTSVSSAGGPNTQTFASYTHVPQLPDASSQSKPKQRKSRLTNDARKEICIYHEQNPNARQEDIANKYGVERSTISKILKEKIKWMKIPAHEGSRTAKHRPSKFPELEEVLERWLPECSKNKVALSDGVIRAKAKEIAHALNITDEKFKASSGWIENFKHRQNIRGGVWYGNCKNGMAGDPQGASILGGSLLLSPMNQSFELHSEPMEGTAGPSQYEGALDHPQGDRHHQHQSSATQLQAGSMILQSSWSEQSTHPSSNHSSSHSHEGNAPIMSEVRPHAQLDHSDASTNQLSHSLHEQRVSQTVHPNHEAQYDPSPVYNTTNLPLYQPAPSIPDNSPVTLESAEDAINRVILFLDTTGQGIITNEERQALNTIKCAMFQAGSGVPFDRSQH